MKHIHARILAAWIIDLIRVGKDYEVRNLEINKSGRDLIE